MAAIQGLTVIGKVVGMATVGEAVFADTLAIMLAVLVLVLLYSAEVTEWFWQVGGRQPSAEIEEVPPHLPPVDLPGIG